MEINASLEVSIIVKEEDTAKAISLDPTDDFPAVYATSKMVAVMELAAARLMQPLLKDGELSVGVNVNINHLAPTPVGSTITAKATYLGTEGKLYKFKVEVIDNAGLAGNGEHTRAIIETARLLAGAAKRG